jgi:hypothetical protein
LKNIAKGKPMADRSSRREVRNPLLALPEAKAIMDQPREDRIIQAALFRAFAAACRKKAQVCWDTHKAPMAVYWKAVSVVAGHVARIMAA